MTDIPILFSGPMVLSILDGRKKQTRRTDFGVKIERQVNDRFHVYNAHGGCFDVSEEDVGRVAADYARYAAGDRLWVRETWAHYQIVNHIRRTDGRAFDEVSDGLAGYRADGHDTIEDFRDHVRLMSGCDLEEVIINGDKWRPSIHMPRWASRLTLIVESVKVERLQEIGEEDALDEGIVQSKVSFEYDEGNGQFVKEKDWFSVPGIPDPGCGTSATDMFATLWETINGVESLQANPYVCAITFRAIHANIDSEEAKAASVS